MPRRSIAPFAEHRFDRVIHLAAQAGVRHSLEPPHEYVSANVVGFLNILEACRHAATPHLTYASTSSVYGANTLMPFSEHHGVDHPLQLYAATKRANELMAHAYSHLFRPADHGPALLHRLRALGPARHGAVPVHQGHPCGRADQGLQPRQSHARFHLCRRHRRGRDPRLGPAGRSRTPAGRGDAPDPATSNAPFRIFNIGNNTPVKLGDYIAAIEEAVGREAIREYLPLQPGDVPDTFADVSELAAAVGYRPSTPVRQGVRAFVDWYREYYGV